MKRIGILLTLLISFSLQAQKVNFIAKAPKAVEMGEVFQITYEVNANGKNFIGPNFTNFEILGGPYVSSSSSTQIINGSMTSTRSLGYTYQIRALKVGNFKLSPAQITVKGKTIKSSSPNIQVVQGANNNGSNPSSQNNINQDDNSNNNAGIIFGRSFASKKQAYIGEPIIISQKIFSKKQITNISDFKEPSYDGFWKEKIDIGDLKVSRESYNNQVYNTVVLQKLIIFPQKTGKLEIGSFDINGVISIRKTRKARDQWEQWMYGNKVTTSENTNVKINSPKLFIQVKPLPEAGKPDNFSGLIGQFSMQAQMDKKQVNANDAINLKIKIKGKGNIDLLDISAPQLPPDFESYDPKISTKKEIGIDGVHGSKTFEYLIIPRAEGKFRIPPITFSYFDSKLKKYVTLRSDTFDIQVGQGNGENGTITQSKQDIQYIKKDIQYIHTNEADLQEIDSHFFNSLWHWLSLSLLLILGGIIYIFMKKQATARADVSSYKNRLANKVAQKRLKKARLHLKNQNVELFYQEISTAIWGYLSDKFRIPIAELSMDTTRNKVDGLLDQAIIDDIIALLEACEFARFAPAKSKTNIQDVYDKTLNTITKIEKNLKS